MWLNPLPNGGFIVTEGSNYIVVRDEEDKKKLREALCSTCPKNKNH